MAEINYVDAHVGARVNLLRSAAQISIDEAAIAIDLTKEDYMALEAGEKRFYPCQLLALSQKFGVEMCEIFDKIGPLETIESIQTNVVYLFPYIQ